MQEVSFPRRFNRLKFLTEQDRAVCLPSAQRGQPLSRQFAPAIVQRRLHMAGERGKHDRQVIALAALHRRVEMRGGAGS